MNIIVKPLTIFVLFFFASSLFSQVPSTWNSSNSYSSGALVLSNSGVTYIAQRDILPGTLLTNTSAWLSLDQASATAAPSTAATSLTNPDASEVSSLSTPSNLSSSTGSNLANFRFGFKHLDENGSETYLHQQSGIKKYSEWQTPPLTYYGPTTNDSEGRLTYKFSFSGPLVSARARIALASFNFSYSSLGNLGNGFSSAWASNDGVIYVKLLDNPLPTSLDSYQTFEDLLPNSVLGGNELYLQIRLQASGASNTSFTTAQFARSDANAVSDVFYLDANYTASSSNLTSGEESFVEANGSYNILKLKEFMKGTNYSFESNNSGVFLESNYTEEWDNHSYYDIWTRLYGSFGNYLDKNSSFVGSETFIIDGIQHKTSKFSKKYSGMQFLGSVMYYPPYVVDGDGYYAPPGTSVNVWETTNTTYSVWISDSLGILQWETLTEITTTESWPSNASTTTQTSSVNKVTKINNSPAPLDGVESVHLVTTTPTSTNSDANTSIPGTKLWEFQTGSYIQSSLAIAADGTVYVGSNDHKLYALNGTTGNKLWEFSTGDYIQSSPAITADGTVYVGSNDTKLYALNGTTGNKLWEFSTGGSIDSPAIAADGTVYVGSYDKKLYALNGSAGPATDAPWPMFGQNPQRTGSVKSSATTVSTGTQTSSFVDENGSYVLAKLEAFMQAQDYIYENNQTREEVTYSNEWNSHLSYFSDPYDPELDDSSFSPLLVTEENWGFSETSYPGYGTVTELTSFIGQETLTTGDGNFLCDHFRFSASHAVSHYIPEFNRSGSSTRDIWLHPEHGILAWKLDSGPMFVVKSFQSAGGQAVIIGTKLWEFSTGGYIESSPAIAADGTVYVGSRDKKLYALSGTTGTKIWEFETGNYNNFMTDLASSPAIGANGTVYVGSDDYKLYAVNGMTGAKIWEFETGDMIASSPVIGADGTVYVGSDDSKLYAVNGTTGTKIWEFETGSWIESSPAIGADGTVYVGSDDSKLYAVKGSNGTSSFVDENGSYVFSKLNSFMQESGYLYENNNTKESLGYDPQWNLFQSVQDTYYGYLSLSRDAFSGTLVPSSENPGNPYNQSYRGKEIITFNGMEYQCDVFQFYNNSTWINDLANGSRTVTKIISIHPQLGILAWEDSLDISYIYYNSNGGLGGLGNLPESIAVRNSTNIEYSIVSLEPIDLENGLVAQYSFDGNFSDGSGGTDQGNTSQVAYFPGKTAHDLAIRSMGSDSLQSYFISSMIRAYAANNPRALSIWFRATAFPGNTGSWGKSNLGQFVLPSRVVAPLRMLSDNTIGWDTGDGVRFFSLPTGSQIADGEWHHLVASYGGSILDGEGAIYFDGQKLTGGNTMWGNQSSYAFKSGPIINGGGDQGLVAYDDIRIYDRALAQVEVSQIRQAELPTTKLTEETSSEQVLTASDGFDSISDPGSAVTLSGGAEIETGEKLPDQTSNIRIKPNLAFAYQKGNALLRKHYKLGNFNMRYKAHVYGAGGSGGGAMGTYLQYASNPDRRLNFRLLSEENGQPTSRAELRIEKENDGVEVLKSVDLSTILWNQKLASSTSEHWPVSVRMMYLNKKLIFYLNGIKAMEYAIDLVGQGVLTSDGFGQVGFSGETGKNPVSHAISDWTLQSEPGTYTGVAQQFTLSLSASTGGSVSGGGTYTVDSNVSIQATANNGYKFIGWSGAEGEVSTDSQTTVLVQADTSIQASFEYIGLWADGSAKGTDSLFSNATRTVALNWWYSPWFGYFWHNPNKDWIYHSTLGWIYFYPLDSSSSWAYIQRLNGRPYWLWLHRDHFPFAYSQLAYERVDSKGHWLYLDLLRKRMRLWKESEEQWTEETKLQNSDSKEQEELEPAITSNTYIKIFFDSSGSMNSTLSKLNEMVEGEYSNPNSLRSILQDFYATGAKESEGNFDTATNGSDRFGERVKIVSNETERTFAKLLNSDEDGKTISLGFGTGPNDPFPDASNVVVIVFQDESDGAYYRKMFYNNDKETEYELDIKAFREDVNELNILNPSFYRGIIMQVQYVDQEFKEFLGAVVQGTGSYTGEFGLSDPPFTEYLNVVNDLEDGSSTQSYYRDFVGQALIDLGFKINL